MRTLLVSINAKYIHTNNAVRLLKANCDFDVDVIEYTIKDDINEIIDYIENYKADVVGFSCYIWNISLIIKILKKTRFRGSKVVLGGPEVSYESTFFINKYPVDYIVRGEGELSFNLLLKALKSQNEISTITNLTYLEGNKVIHTKTEEIQNLNNLVLPYYFEEDLPHIPNKISYIESSRGCPYKCSYCLSSLEEKVRFFNVDKVKESILYLMKNGTRTIKFLDRTFNANKNTLDLLKFIIENNNSYTVFQFEITGDILDPTIIEFLNSSAPKGLFRFEIGIQSINYQTNYLVDRVQDNDKLFKNIKMIQDGNVIDLHLDLIAGLPKEDLSSFKHTFDEVFRLGAKELQLGFLKMLRGTKIRIEADKYSYKYDEAAPYQIISNESLTENDIETIHLVEHMLEIHHNKGYFKEEMHNIILKKDSPFDFLYTIGKEYLSKAHSMRGYQIENVYKRVFQILDDNEIYLLKKDYLNRSKIKPKLFFSVVKDKTDKQKLFLHIEKTHNIDRNILYKYSVIIENQKEYYIVIYQENKSHNITIKKEDIN